MMTSTCVIISIAVLFILLLLMLYFRHRKKSGKKKRKANIETIVAEINDALEIINETGLNKIRSILIKYMG